MADDTLKQFESYTVLSAVASMLFEEIDKSSMAMVTLGLFIFLRILRTILAGFEDVDDGDEGGRNGGGGNPPPPPGGKTSRRTTARSKPKHDEPAC